MRKYQAFEIAFVGLKNEVHHFNYEVDNAFFESFSPPDFKDSKLSILLTMDKKDNFFLLNFEITGSIWTVCDRCGDPVEMNIWDEFPLVVKRVGDPKLMQRENDDPNMAFIAQQESVMNVVKWVYEFSLLSIPMQSIHPNDKASNSTSNPDTLRALEEMKKGKEEKDNPLWKGLKQFRNK